MHRAGDDVPCGTDAAALHAAVFAGHYDTGSMRVGPALEVVCDGVREVFLQDWPCELGLGDSGELGESDEVFVGDVSDVHAHLEG